MPAQKIKQHTLSKDLAFGSVSLTEKAMFAEHLSVMLKSGLTIADALVIAKESTRGRLKYVISQVSQSVEAGHSLSESMEKHPNVFSGLFVNAVRAGEMGGTLEENLTHISEQFEKDQELISKVRGAMMYPIVVLIASFFLVMVISFVVLPKITPLFRGLDMDLPFTTRAVIAFSEFVQAHGVALFLGIVAIVICFIWFVRRKFSHPLTHWVSMHTPVLKKITRNKNLAQFARTLGTLLKSGLTIDEAMRITTDTMEHFYFKQALKRVSQRIGKGTSLSDNLFDHTNLFPVMLVSMVHVGEQSGRLDETLLYLARYHEHEVDGATKALSTAIEPILLLGIGLVVGFVALSIITPIYNITGNIQR